MKGLFSHLVHKRPITDKGADAQHRRAYDADAVTELGDIHIEVALDPRRCLGDDGAPDRVDVLQTEFTQVTPEHHRLRVVEHNKASHHRADGVGALVHHLDDLAVTALDGLLEIGKLQIPLLFNHLLQKRILLGVCQELGSFEQGSAPGYSLKAAYFSALALLRVSIDAHVSDIAAHTAVAPINTALHDKPCTDAGSELDKQNILAPILVRQEGLSEGHGIHFIVHKDRAGVEL